MEYSRRDQLLMLLVTSLSFPISYLTLELPKRIIDDAIGGSGFPREFLGFEFEQVEYLFLLCALFLFLFVASNAIKFTLNLMRGRTGERLLRRLRYMLIDRFMRLRRGDERHYTAGEVVQMVAAEVQPLGNFAGDFFATPVMQTGTLIVLLGFIFVQDAVLGLAAVALLPVQAIVIPQLQKRVVRLTRARIVSVRGLSDEIGENVSSLDTVRAYDARRWRLAVLSDRLLENYDLRLAIFNQKFLIKFTNNVLNQVTPFAFYSVGGYYVIQGEIAIGALVAVIAAHKDLQAPWKELLRYYQDYSDISSRYDALIERFALGETEPEHAAASAPPQGAPVLELAGVEVADIGPITAPARIGGGETARIVGGDENQRSEVVAVLIGLKDPLRGRVALDGVRPQEFSSAIRAERIALVDRAPNFFRASVRENLALALARPPEAPEEDDSRRIAEARLSGNLATPTSETWIDPTIAGFEDIEALDRHLLALATELSAFDPIFTAGLSSAIDPEAEPDMAARALEMRAEIRAEDAASGGLVDVVEFWDAERFNESAPLVENLLFGAAETGPKTPREFAEDPVLRKALKSHPIEQRLMGLGADVIDATADLLEAVGANSSALRDFDLYPPDQVADYRATAAAFKRGGRLSRLQRRRLRMVAFGLTPARHRLGLLDDALKAEIIAARADFAGLEGFQRFDSETLLAGLSLRDNLLLGRPRLSRRDQWPRIGARLRALAEERGIAHAIARLGLNADIKGRDMQLSSEQGIRFSVIRAVLGRPRMLVLDGPGGASTGIDAALLASIKRVKGEAVLIYTSAANGDAESIDHTIALPQDREPDTAGGAEESEPESMVDAVSAEGEDMASGPERAAE